MKYHKEFDFDEEGNIPLELSNDIRKIGLRYKGKHFQINLDNETKRTIPQNSGLHLYINIITTFLRESKKQRGDEEYYKINFDRVKLWIREEFLGYEEINRERQLRHTSNLNKIQMIELFENLQIYFAPLGLELPELKKDYYEDKLRS